MARFELLTQYRAAKDTLDAGAPDGFRFQLGSTLLGRGSRSIDPEDVAEKARLAEERKMASERMAPVYGGSPLAAWIDEVTGTTIEAAGIGEANARDVQKMVAEGQYGEAALATGRSVLGVLPLVPRREASPESQYETYLRQLARQDLAKGDLGHKVAQTAAGAAGFLSQYATAAGPLKAAGKAIAPKVASPFLRNLLGAKDAAGSRGLVETTTQGLVPGATAMGVVSAEDSLYAGDYRQALKDFAGGAATDLMLRVAGGAGATLPNQFLGGRLSEATLAKLRGPSAGLAQGVALTAQHPEKDDLATQLAANLLTFGAIGALPGARKALPGVEQAVKGQARSTEPFTPPTQEQIAAASLPRESKLELQGDPKFTALQRGKVAAYFMPKSVEEGGPTYLTTAEKAQAKFGFPERTPDGGTIKSVETADGTFYYVDRKIDVTTPSGGRFTAPAMGTLEQKLLTPEFKDIAVFKTGASGKPIRQVDVEASIQKAIAENKRGVLLELGTPSKEGATHTVTAFDRFGREIEAVMTPDVAATMKAFKSRYEDGRGFRFETKPLEQGLLDAAIRRGMTPEGLAKAAESPVATPKPAEAPSVTPPAKTPPEAPEAIGFKHGEKPRSDKGLEYGKPVVTERPTDPAELAQRNEMTNLSRRAAEGDIEAQAIIGPSATRRLQQLLAAYRQKAKNPQATFDEMMANIDLVMPRRERGSLLPSEDFVIPRKQERYALEDRITDTMRKFLPQFDWLAEPAPDVYRATAFAQSVPIMAATRAKMGANAIHQLASNPKLERLLATELVDAQAEGMVAQGRPVPDHLFKSRDEAADIAANAVEIQNLMRAFKDVTAVTRDLETAAGIQSRRPIRDDAAYSHLTTINLGARENPQTGMVEFTSRQVRELLETEKRTGEPQMKGDPEIMAAVRSGQVPVGSPVYHKLAARGLLEMPQAARAGAAKYATGDSGLYSLNIHDILQATFSDMYSAAARNKLIEAFRAQQVPRKMVESTDPLTGEPTMVPGDVPTITPFGGKMVPVEAMPIGELPAWLKQGGSSVVDAGGEWIMVPSPIKSAYETLRRFDPTADPNIAAKITGELAGIDASLTLQDSTRQILHAISTISTVPGSTGTGVAGKIINFIGGPARFAVAGAKAMNVVHTPLYAQRFEHLLRHGAIDIRSIGELDAPSRVSDTIQNKVPGAPFMQELTWGPQGVVNRVKVAFYSMLRDAGVPDAIAIRETIRATGSPVRGLQPAVVRGIRDIGVDPYINAHYRALYSGARSMGVGGEGANPAILVGTLSSIAWATVLSNWLAGNDQDQLDRVAGLPNDFRLGYVKTNGRQVPFLRTFEPNTERLMRQTGISALIENAAMGNLSWDNALEIAGKAAWTQTANRVGPLYNLPVEMGAVARYSRFGNRRQAQDLGPALVASVPGAGGFVDARREAEENALATGEATPVGRQIVTGVMRNMLGGGDIKALDDIEVQKALSKARDAKYWDSVQRTASKVRINVKEPGRWLEAVEKDAAVIVDETERMQFISDVLDKIEGSYYKDAERDVLIREGQGR